MQQQGMHYEYADSCGSAIQSAFRYLFESHLQDALGQTGLLRQLLEVLGIRIVIYCKV